MWKELWLFSYFCWNIGCDSRLIELPHVGVNEYPQSMFSVICKRRFHITRSRSFAQSIYYLDCKPGHNFDSLQTILGEGDCLVVRALDSGARDRGSILTQTAVLCTWARPIYSPKVLVIPRKWSPKRHDWKIVYLDVKQNTKRNENSMFHYENMPIQYTVIFNSCKNDKSYVMGVYYDCLDARQF